MPVSFSRVGRWFSRARGSTSGRVAIAVGPDGLAVAVVDANKTVVFCQFFEPEGDIWQMLADLVAEQSWQGMSCSLVLHPVYYQLLLTEQPPVPSDEMSQAVRWKVKELLDYPVEEAAIEHFLLPEDAYRGRQKMLYAAALRKSSLKSLVEPVEEMGLTVDCVEIAELAMHKLIARYPAEGGGIALLQFHDGEAFINLVEGGNIYLTRRLDIGLAAFQPDADNTRFFDSLYLEVQRSLDFYESQLGKGIITRLCYAPAMEDIVPIGRFLSNQLGLNIEAVHLSRLDFIHSTIDLDNRCASAIGAALGPVSENSIKAAAREASRAAS